MAVIKIMPYVCEWPVLEIRKEADPRNSLDWLLIHGFRNKGEA